MAVDFGKKGGFAWNGNDRMQHLDMPMNSEGEQSNHEILRLFVTVKPKVLYGEKVHSMPSQGVVSVATFMEGKGAIVGMCLALGIRVELFEPSVWTRWYEMGRRSDFLDHRGNKDITAWKNHLHKQANLLFPDARITKKCADAVLIWNYALNPQRIKKLREASFT